MKLFLSIKEFDEAQRRRVQSLMGDSAIQLRENYDDDAPLEAAIQGCEIVFGNVPAGWLPKSSKLRWAQLDSVGFGEYRSLDWPQLERQITLTNLAGFFADPVAQTALAGILSLYRGIDVLVTSRSTSEWVGDPIRAQLRSLTGVNVLLFGYGTINQRLAALLSCFDCNITSFTRSWHQHALDSAISTADIVVSSVPETDNTINVFNRERLGLMRHDALFVNCGRGSVVDEVALVEALELGELGGAVIDVTHDEPIPAGHSLWSSPKTILTQHSGGGTQDELDRKIDVFERNLARYKQSQPLENRVDFHRGY